MGLLGAWGSLPNWKARPHPGGHILAAGGQGAELVLCVVPCSASWEPGHRALREFGAGLLLKHHDSEKVGAMDQSCKQGWWAPGFWLPAPVQAWSPYCLGGHSPGGPSTHRQCRGSGAGGLQQGAATDLRAQSTACWGSADSPLCWGTVAGFGGTDPLLVSCGWA